MGEAGAISQEGRGRLSLSDRAYDELRAMAIDFRLRPGEPISETALAADLGLSRTPLREALNRLAKEGFLEFTPRRGFRGRRIDPRKVLELYETRLALETGIIGLAAERAPDDEVAALEAFLDESAQVPEDAPVLRLVELDESFHMRLAALARNGEMARLLDNINARIRFIRWINMRTGRRPRTQGEHRAILAALRARDVTGAQALLKSHITLRLDEIIEAVRAGLADIYLGQYAEGGDAP